MRHILAALFLAVSVIPDGFAATGPAPDQTLKCPQSREFLASSLKTRPEDGVYYERTQRSIKMRIGDVLTFLGGRKKARAIATQNRDSALKRIEAGVQGAEKRYREDTVLRADALLQILDCLDAQKSV
ncbi:MAG: hypothetical protein OEU46_01610 [Alphaproteobacteria bacterium]|nr:hypothetical protein [Alphaproteobacteria bacterium]